tara:strand:- start:2396 stop:3136 length:741 start_codon:yes stop_codon:yes gene_type:complete
MALRLKNKPINEKWDGVTKEAMVTDFYFSTPVYRIEKPEWLSSAIKATDKYIKEAEKNLQPDLKERKKLLGNKDYSKVKDHGLSYHSTPLNGDPGLKQMEEYIGQTSFNLLDEWGYDMKKYSIFFTEFWVQEFAKQGGGHHSTHVHWDNHISGFYFLKCSDKTSYPVFHDPRAGAMMTKLPQKDGRKISIMSDQLHYKPKPGTLIFFPGYVPHEFAVDLGIDPFRFIHFNLQAVRNNIIDSAKGMK